jgi:RNA polymerase sigma factor (sigma-70 family)
MSNRQRTQPAVSAGTLAGAARLADGTDAQLLERFAHRKDAAAFAALLRRHGPMVLGVCRRVLHNVHDAEDAFQATFLVLARKAGALDRPELLANWLYGVAYRTALHIRVQVARRCRLEREAATMSASGSEPESAWDDLRAILDEELQSLPEKYRAPLVLCYLEGLTNEQAARVLGWPAGSMSSRLARGREMLRDRLAGRQGSLHGMAFPAVLTQLLAPPTVPGPLADATVQAVLTTGSVAPAVRALADHIVRGLPSTARPSRVIPLLAILGAFLLFGAAGYLLSGGASAWLAPPYQDLAPGERTCRP